MEAVEALLPLVWILHRHAGLGLWRHGGCGGIFGEGCSYMELGPFLLNIFISHTLNMLPCFHSSILPAQGYGSVLFGMEALMFWLVNLP